MSSACSGRARGASHRSVRRRYPVLVLDLDRGVADAPERGEDDLAVLEERTERALAVGEGGLAPQLAAGGLQAGSMSWM